MQQKKERERENTFECKTLTEQTKMIKEKERYSYAKRRKKKRNTSIFTVTYPMCTYKYILLSYQQISKDFAHQKNIQ